MRKITLATEHSTRKSRYPLKKGPPCLLTEARISMTKSGLAWFIVFSCLG